jgi:uncharacterized protein YqhQ
MMADKIRLGGMALPNGVLVHGPTAWGCAIRLPDGSIRVAAEYKRFRTDEQTPPLLRGPAKLLEALAVLPAVRRALPEARLAFERPTVLAGMLASAAGVRVVRGSSRLGPARQELLSSLLAFTPAVLALRGSELAGYHGAEHVSIGSYEHGEPRPKEHERCGSHLLGPILATSALANALATKAPMPFRAAARVGATFGSIAVSTELFAWMARNPDHPLARALQKPGHELQERLGTREPSAEQLEVADAALRACLDLEEDAAAHA